MTNLAGEDWFRDPALTRVLALLNSDGAVWAGWSVARCATACWVFP